MPSYHYKYTYKYTKSTVIDEEPHHVRHHDDDSIRRLRKRHSSPSARVEKSTSRSNESLRPLWVIVNKIDNHYGVSHACCNSVLCYALNEDIRLIDSTVFVVGEW
jgi:hypothetical protein